VIVGTLGLDTKKPWAIDLKYFTVVPRAVYLRNMAVMPNLQRSGIGRYLLSQATAAVKAWPSEAGAGNFYAKCGFREVGRAAYRNTPLVLRDVAVAAQDRFDLRMHRV
jgi:GNAT superfamily N-acetyltransferase